MHLKYYYWYFQSALPERLCEEIIKYGNSKESQIAKTGHLGIKEKELGSLSSEDLKELEIKRKSEVVWMSDRWIYDEIQPYVREANYNAGWNFEWDWSEACQFTKYKEGQFYDWHCDDWREPYKEDGPRNNKIRKLSVTVSLSDPATYEGGDLEFDFRDGEHSLNVQNIEVCDKIKPRGSLVVFPSFVWHRVTPVTKGTRYSLVIWNLGNPFK
jgi:PKHD-type hydroxylase